MNKIISVFSFNKALNNFFFFVLIIFLQSCSGGKNLQSSVGNLSRKEKKAKIAQAIYTARSYIGTPYKYGGTTKAGMDCSGLLFVSFKAAGLSIPRTSEAQSKIGKNVSVGSLRTGDLVFFAADKKGKRRKRITHVGMVTSVKGGEVIFIHASSSKGVREDRLSSEYWKKVYVKALRPF